MDETAKLLAIIAAYYGRPKDVDPEQMLKAWHRALEDKDYRIASEAVVEFARADRREYRQFPMVGHIIGAIEDEEKKLVRIRNSALYGWPYEDLPRRCRRWISREQYARLKQQPENYMLNTAKVKEDLIRGAKGWKNGKRNQNDLEGPDGGESVDRDNGHQGQAVRAGQSAY